MNFTVHSCLNKTLWQKFKFLSNILSKTSFTTKHLAHTTLLDTAPKKGEHDYQTIQHHYLLSYSFLTCTIFSCITLNHFQLQIPLPYCLSTISFTLKFLALLFFLQFPTYMYILYYLPLHPTQKIPCPTIFTKNLLHQNSTPNHFLNNFLHQNPTSYHH